MGKPLYKVEQFIKAIPGTGGIISSIAKRVGCDWYTARKYIEKYPSVKQAYENECSAIDDLAVSTVLRAIQDGDLATAKWWLSKKRPAEFGDKIDLTSGNEPIKIIIDTNEILSRNGIDNKEPSASMSEDGL